eukprot:3132319-Pyramimonas_sp.AAC.1
MPPSGTCASRAAHSEVRGKSMQVLPPDRPAPSYAVWAFLGLQAPAEDLVRPSWGCKEISRDFRRKRVAWRTSAAFAFGETFWGALVDTAGRSSKH